MFERNLPEIGQSIYATVPWPEEYHDQVGGATTREYMTFQGMIDTEWIRDADVKILYMIQGADDHCLVTWNGADWIFDLFGLDDEAVVTFGERFFLNEALAFDVM